MQGGMAYQPRTLVIVYYNDNIVKWKLPDLEATLCRWAGCRQHARENIAAAIGGRGKNGVEGCWKVSARSGKESRRSCLSSVLKLGANVPNLSTTSPDSNRNR